MTSPRVSFGPIPSIFSGLVWEPSNEQDVVMLFGMLVALQRFVEPLRIQACATAFPDCEAINPANEEERIKIEFEYRSSAFKCHMEEWLLLKKLEPGTRWMIVCWENDLGNEANFPEVVSLKELVKAAGLVQRFVPDDVVAKFEERFDWRVAGLTLHQQAVLKRLRDFGETKACGSTISWPARNDFSFVVELGGGSKFYGSAMGTVVIPFGKWRGVSDAGKQSVIEKLQTAFPQLASTFNIKRKKGYDIDVLLPDDEAVGRFLQLWRDVAAEQSP